MQLSKADARRIRDGILLAKEYQYQLQGYANNPMTTERQFDRLSKSYIKVARYSLSKLGQKAYKHTIDQDIKKRTTKLA